MWLPDLSFFPMEGEDLRSKHSSDTPGPTGICELSCTFVGGKIDGLSTEHVWIDAHPNLELRTERLLPERQVMPEAIREAEAFQWEVHSCRVQSIQHLLNEQEPPLACFACIACTNQLPHQMLVWLSWALGESGHRLSGSHALGLSEF